MRANRLAWVSLVLVPLVVGCKEGGPRTTGYLAKPGGEQIRVAVLPFDSASLQFENAGLLVSQEMVTTLLATGLFEVVDPGAVYQAMVDGGLRNGTGYGFGPAAMEKMQEKLGPVRIFVAGIVQEFGEVRIGPASYPSVSINARAIDAQTGAILWSGSVSRTGADSERFFGLGAVHSTGRLARAAVRDLVASVNARELARLVRSSAPAAPDGTPLASAAHAMTGASPRTTGRERYFDEGPGYPEAALIGLLPEVSGLARGPVEHREHHYSMVETSYQSRETAVHARLVDYRAVEAALGFVRHDHPDETEGTFAGLPAYAGTSAAQMPGGYYLDIAVGRFGLFLEGPGSRQSEIERIARALILAMK